MVKTYLLTTGNVFPVAFSLLLQVLTLIFHGDVYSQERPEVTEPQGQEINLVTNPTDAFGYLKFQTNIDSFYVYVDGHIENYKKISRLDSLKLSVGIRKITMASEIILDKNFEVIVIENTVMQYPIHFGSKITSYEILLRQSSFPRIYHKANLIIFTDDDSDIFIDGRWLGRGYVKVDTLAGKYVVESNHKYAGTSKNNVEVKSNRLLLVEMYNKPKKSVSTLLTIVPGWNQFYKNRKIKGAILFALAASSFGAAYLQNQRFENENEKYVTLLNNYANANSETEASLLGDQLGDSFDAAKKAANLRDILLYAAIGTYVLNFIDAIIIGPKGGYRQKQRAMPLGQIQPFIGEGAAGMQFRMNF